METRAPYALIGLFVLTVIAAVFGFVYWLHNSGGLSERTVYQVRFENTVSGLLKGAAVLFNGIRIGEVTDLRLDTNNPSIVMARIAVDAGTPIRADTKASLDFQGLTGVPVITLQGGSKPFDPVTKSPTEPPVLAADPMAGQSMTSAARDTLRRLDGILTENATAIRSTIANLNTFSGALARNSDRLDGIIGGLERMMGVGQTKAAPVVYDLTAPTKFPPLNPAAQSQLSVAKPTALIMFDSRRILVRPAPSQDPSFATAEWSDNVPDLLQAKIVQAFENAGLAQEVSRAMEGGGAEQQLTISVRKFQLSVSNEPVAEVEFAARILSDNGKIVRAKVFHASVPVNQLNAAAAAAAIDQAFGQCAIELVVWATGAA